MAEIASRRISTILEAFATEEPVIPIHGPRAVGKSTVLAVFAASRGVSVLDLDDAHVRDLVLANPTQAVGGTTPVCLDEYQRAPDVLDAIKARLNREGSRPGTAVITGSTRQDALPRTAQALTGRLHSLTIWPLSQGEIGGVIEDLLSALRTDPDAAVAAHPTSETSRADYVARVVAGGFPMALRREGASRNRWFDNYATQSIEQYVRLLEDLLLVHRLPAWGKTLRARASATPKVHIVDSGLAARLLGVSEAKLATLDPTTQPEFGHLLETFVVGELRKQASWLDERVTTGHWRTHDGDEVDLVIEFDDGNVLAFEVKANERVTGDEFKGLRKLREALGARLIAGVAFSTGARSYTYQDRLHVLPIDRLWRPVAPTLSLEKSSRDIA